MKKVVVITGASSGIGEATARMLGKDYQVVLGARREERLKKLVGEINQAGGTAVYKVTDVSKNSDVEDLAKLAINQFKRIDVWINNAGTTPQSWLKEKRIADWNQLIDVNLKGTLYGIGAALPYMRAQKSGQIINISSVLGLSVIPGGTVYAGTKHAVRAITEGLRQEVAADHDNIRVTAIYPGAIETEFYSNLDEVTRKKVKEDYQAVGAIPPERVALVIKNTIEMPEDTSLNDIVIRPVNEVW